MGSILAVFPNREAASSRGARPSKGGTCSLAPCWRGIRFVTSHMSRMSLDWRDSPDAGVTMVGDFLFDAFAHDELLAKRLAG